MYRLCCSFLFFFGLARGFSPIVKTRTNLAPATSSSALSMGIKDAIVGRFRKKKEIEVVPIMVGQSLPGRCEIAFVIARHFANSVARSDVDVQKIVFDVEGDDIGDEIVEAPSSARMDEAVSINDIVGRGKSILVGMVRNELRNRQYIFSRTLSLNCSIRILTLLDASLERLQRFVPVHTCLVTSPTRRN